MRSPQSNPSHVLFVVGNVVFLAVGREVLAVDPVVVSCGLMWQGTGVAAGTVEGGAVLGMADAVVLAGVVGNSLLMEAWDVVEW